MVVFPESTTGIRNGRRKVLASKYVFRKEAGNRDIQNINPETSEARGKILISMYEHGVRSRDSD